MALEPAAASAVPLVTEHSETVESPFFWVFPGEIVIAQAFGFACSAAREDTTERLVPQEACLQMVLFKESRPAPPPDGCPCVRVYSLKKVTAKVIAIDDVMLDGCCVCLSARGNLMLINVPGAYRFVLNDASALGSARIFLRAVRASDIPHNSPFLMGV